MEVVKSLVILGPPGVDTTHLAVPVLDEVAGG